MVTKTQANRFVSVTSPLGADVLLLVSMTGQEHLSRLFTYDLELVSEHKGIDTNKILGDTVTIPLVMPNNEKRYFNGFVSRFTNEGTDGGYTRFRATLVPWLWLLTRTSDCRIFQEKTVPDIIKEVFRDNGFSGFDDRLTGSYRTWEYCVQYRETAFNFVSRLMEQEGIYYYFEHQQGQHTLVLADSIRAHGAYPGYEMIKFFPPSGSGRRDEEHVSQWSVSHEVRPGSYTHKDYDFKVPRKAMKTVSKIEQDHPAAEGKIFDYPGEYTEYNDGETYAKTRIEELHAGFEVARGDTDAHGLACGFTFELDNHPDPQQGREYLVTSANYSINSDAFGSGGQGGDQAYTCQFTAIDTKQPFRPARITPKPIIQGLQTAIVVGKDGEEIWTDKYGRVKVKFHWDRYNPPDENASCWIRVSQVWAGKSWGAMFIPRIGQEVIVEFIEGDPDRPMITGRVYNGDNMPPYPLPNDRNCSGFKSNSTKGGGGYNEIKFDDTKGTEQIVIHGQYDMNTTVKHDRSTTLETGNDTLAVQTGTRSVTVKGDTSLTVQAGNRSVSVTGGNYSADVNGGDFSGVASAAVKLHGKGAGAQMTGDAAGVTITGNGGPGVKVDGTPNFEATGASLAQITSPLVKIGDTVIEVKGSTITIDGSSVIKLVSGGSSIEITPGGININSSGPVTVTGAVVKHNS